MAKEKDIVNFDEFSHLPLPTLVTDIFGKLIYKNELATKHFNVRRGCNIYKFCDEETAEQEKVLANAGVPSVITLRQTDNACCCLVIPRKQHLIFTVIPYTFEFFGREALAVKSDNETIKNYFNQLEERIAYLIDFLDGKGELITDSAKRRLKNNALKLMRLEKRIRTRLVENTDTVIRTINYNSNKSVELCFFVSKITQMINSLSDVVGFRLIYVPRKDYSICNLNSTALTKLLIYISIFSVKYSKASDVKVYVEQERDKAYVVFDMQSESDMMCQISNFDFGYIYCCAKELGYNLTIEKSESGKNYLVKLELSSTKTAGTSLSSVNTLFDVSSAYIKQIFDECFEFIGE